ncbi:MAG: LTA synthase family protein [Limosilactobacillus sp.]
MNKVKEKASILLILFWVGINQVYWQLSPHIGTYSDESLHTSINLLLRTTTAIGPDLVMLLLGLLASAKVQHAKPMVIKAWLNTLVLGGLACLILMLCTIVPEPVIFNSLLPILRNSYPLITGTLIGLVTGEIIGHLPKIWQERTVYLIFILIALPFFSTPNMFGWVDNGLPLFYALLFVLGQYGFKFWATKFSHRTWFFVGIGAYIVNCLLQFIMPYFSTDSAVIQRYATPVNALTVICAFSIIILLKESLRISLWFLVSYLTLIENSTIIAWLTGIVDNKISHSSLKTGIFAILVTIAAIVLAWAWGKLVKLSIVHRYVQSINQFVEQPFSGQITALKKKLPLTTVWQLLIAYLMAVISLFAMSFVSHMSNGFGQLLKQQQLVILLNALFIFATIKFIQATTHRYWVSLSLTILLNIVLIIANSEKIAARSEPILPADLVMLKAGKQIFSMVNGQIWLISIFILAVVTAITCWLELRHPVRFKWSLPHIITYCLLLPLMLLSSLTWNKPNTPLSNFLISLGDSPSFYDQLAGARSNGPLIQYLNNVDVTIMDKPAGYSATTMKKVVKRYQKEAQLINQHRSNRLDDQTLIFNLSESFANPNRVPGVKLKNNPVPFITKMAKQNTGGIMISSGYGGGTANMEYMTLTGYSLANFSPTLPTPYTQLVPTLRQNPSIVDSFKHSIAIHPYAGVVYSRTTVYKKFGFNRFLYLGSNYPIKHQYKIDRSPYLSDKTAYANALDQINNKQRGQFINLVTMQNHYPYDQHFYNNNSRYSASRVSHGTSISALNDYTTGIHYTDNYVKTFIKQIDRINKPITIVFYGDHLPGSIYGNDMHKDGLKLHETDYFIYSNKYARNHGAHNFHDNTRFVSPNDFIAMAAKQTNSKVNWYQALLTAVYEKIPALATNMDNSTTNLYNTSGVFVNRNGKIVKKSSLTKKQKQIFHDYQLIQYDVTAGKHYTSKYFK